MATSFDMYLMFRPAGGQWVAIQKTDYGMLFHEKRTPGTNDWVAQEPGAFRIVASANTDSHPEWTSLVTRSSFKTVPDGSGLIQ